MPVLEVPNIRVVLFNKKPLSGKSTGALSASLCDSDDGCSCDSDTPLPCVCDSGPCSSEHCIDICGCESDNDCPCEAVSVPPPCSCDNDSSSSTDDNTGKIEVSYRYRTTFKIADEVEVVSGR
ncbi:MAG: hypothetical protein WBM14_04125 [Terracidiphilus sp.]